MQKERLPSAAICRDRCGYMRQQIWVSVLLLGMVFFRLATGSHKRALMVISFLVRDHHVFMPSSSISTKSFVLCLFPITFLRPKGHPLRGRYIIECLY